MLSLPSRMKSVVIASRWSRIDPSRVQTIYNGLNLSDWITTFRPAITKGDILVTSVGNIRRVKGYDILIKGGCVHCAALFWCLVQHRRGRIGARLLRRTARHGLADLNLSDRFHFVGGVTDLLQHLCAADIFVLPSRSEGFSNAIVEAMAASLPVIATDVGEMQRPWKTESVAYSSPPTILRRSLQPLRSCSPIPFRQRQWEQPVIPLPQNTSRPTP